MAVTILPFSNQEDFGPFRAAREAAGEEEKLKLARILNQYKPEELRIANALKQNELNYAPRMSAAQLAYNQALLPHLNAQTRGLEINNRFSPERLMLANKQAAQNLNYPGLDRGDDLARLAYLSDNPNRNQILQYGSPAEQGESEDFNLPFNAPEGKREKMAFNAMNANADLGGLQNMPMIPGMVEGGTPAKRVSDYMIDKMNTDMAYKQAMADRLRNPSMMGSGRGGVKVQNMNSLYGAIKKENNNLTDDQISEGVSQLLSGKTTLSDGTPIEIGGQTRHWLDTTLTDSIGATNARKVIDGANAELELRSLNEDASKLMSGKGYEDTWGGQNLKLMADAASSDPEAQDRVGDWAAGRALMNEAVNVQLKLANAKNTVHAIESLSHDIMKQSNQWFPGMSERSRERMRTQIEAGLRRAWEKRKQLRGSISNALASGDEEADQHAKKPISELSNEEILSLIKGNI